MCIRDRCERRHTRHSRSHERGRRGRRDHRDHNHDGSNTHERSLTHGHHAHNLDRDRDGSRDADRNTPREAYRREGREQEPSATSDRWSYDSDRNSRSRDRQQREHGGKGRRGSSGKGGSRHTDRPEDNHTRRYNNSIVGKGQGRRTARCSHNERDEDYERFKEARRRARAARNAETMTRLSDSPELQELIARAESDPDARRQLQQLARALQGQGSDWLCGTAHCSNNTGRGVFGSKMRCDRCGVPRTGESAQPTVGDWLCGTSGCVNNEEPGVFRSKNRCKGCGARRSHSTKQPHSCPDTQPSSQNTTLAAADVDQEEDCPICLERLVEADQVTKLECDHQCCLECWQMWAEACDDKGGVATCPLCRHTC
eukprot:TRINITY_DN50801_c0_g1_i1.p1 TRINITY_DN50801_c0_g1~~TRINITY_DN50801_c0_g1_i1.p1  ORF type:complete len:371 (+),score=50.48 TRINITY_DN50801_c0_g1_i1:139-1251(+)